MTVFFLINTFYWALTLFEVDKGNVRLNNLHLKRVILKSIV